MFKYFISAVLILSNCFYGQPKSNLSSSEIFLALKKLNVLGSVLYIAAHPDDENTSVISYLAKGKLLRTGYLSLTRGDGGQNLIGPEQDEQLGVIRTQELIEARKRDGGEQFFSRAIDFGYSKSAEETFEIWNKQEILSDVVFIIRAFRPDIIITRFPTTGQGGHGHHTASAILALEAFDLANDQNAFPEHFKFVSTWQTRRVFWNAWLTALQNEKIDLLRIPTLNLGEYSTLLGKSFTEISAFSRSMHKSQGFGASGVRNDLLNYFLLLNGDSVKTDMFEKIDLTWNRVDNGKEINDLILKAIEEFDFQNPSYSLDLLFAIYEKIKLINNNYWKEIKLKEITEIIRSCAGIWIEAICEDEFVSIGDTAKIKTSIVKRIEKDIYFKSVRLNQFDASANDEIKLKSGESKTNSFSLFIPEDYNINQPFWLKNTYTTGLFKVTDQNLIGNPENDPPFTAIFTVGYKHHLIDFNVPVYFRITDPVDGEIYKPLVITPPVTINIEKDIYFLNGSAKKEIKLTLQSFKGKLTGQLLLASNEGWKIEPSVYSFIFDKKYQKKDLYINIFPSINTNSTNFSAHFKFNNNSYSTEINRIEYKHIFPQTIFYDAKANLHVFNFEKKGIEKIGYLTGSGDKIPDFLSDLGFDVTLLDDKQLNSNNLSQYDVIITGIRAYNTRDNLAVFHNELVKYVEQGGTVISQYNTTGDLIAAPGIYPLKLSRDRVTDENSIVTFLNNDHKIFNYPFRITQDDFKNWVQERGLYFPNEWDKNYEALLSMNDKGESEKLGSLLFAKFGKGTFVYTGLSFFRQIPAGVEGAAKLFINLLYSGK